MESRKIERSISRFARLQRASLVGTLGLVPMWFFGQVVRDWSWWSGLCFYIPSPVLAAVLICWVPLHLRRRKARAAILACLAVWPLIFALFVENRLSRDRLPEVSSRLRLVHWNVGGKLDRNRAQVVLLERNADLYILSEIPDSESVEEVRQALGSEYQAQVFGNLAAIGRGKVRADGWLIDHRRTKVQSVTWEYAGKVANVLVVDLPSEIHIHRDPLLREVNELVERYRPELVVGDFNAPRRSRGLSRLPADYRHAYDSAGTGCGYTWPVPIPVFAIDQCIYSKRIVAQNYELYSSWYSDHRVQEFDFSWLP